MMLEVQIIIKNDFGEFLGEKIILEEDKLSKIIEASKSFYKSNGFELHCEDGSFVVFPSDIIRKSILKIVSKKIEENV
jgi:hypothetical protein